MIGMMRQNQFKSWNCLQQFDFCLSDENNPNSKRCLEIISVRLQRCEEQLNKAAAPDLHASAKQLAAAIFKRAAGLIVTERQAFAGTCTSKSAQHNKMPFDKKDSSPQGSVGGSLPVTCGLKPFPPLIWCLRIRLCYSPVAPAVHPAARGCRNISQKDWCSAEGSRHEALEPHQRGAPSVSFARQPAFYL